MFLATKNLPVRLESLVSNVLKNVSLEEAREAKKRKDLYKVLQTFAGQLQPESKASKKAKQEIKHQEEVVQQASEEIKILEQEQMDIQNKAVEEKKEQTAIQTTRDDPENSSELKMRYDALLQAYEESAKTNRENVQLVTRQLASQRTEKEALEKELQALRERQSREQQHVQFRVPALPQWVYDIFVQVMPIDRIDDLLLNVYTYQDFQILWDKNRKTLGDFKKTFDKEPYSVDKEYFHNVAFEKAETLSELLKNETFKKLVESDSNLAHVIVDMYLSLRQQLVAYKTVLDSMKKERKNTRPNFWNFPKSHFSKDILFDVPDEQSFILELTEKYVRSPEQKELPPDTNEDLLLKDLSEKDWNTFYKPQSLVEKEYKLSPHKGAKGPPGKHERRPSKRVERKKK
jgi:hypothetical protein